MKIEQLYDIENVVKKILERDVESRKDDFILYLNVCKELNVDTTESFEKVLTRYPLPPFESVSRSRRKLFNKYPELAIPRVQRNRRKQEDVYVEYARQRG